MKVVFMGTPEFSILPLERLVSGPFEVAAVYTQPDRTAGRGQTLVSSPVKKAAEDLGLRVVQPVSFRREETMEELKAIQPDLAVVAAYGKILPQVVLDIPVHGCINIHPSLLPRHRGVSPVPASILAGDEFTGVSIMLLDAGTDTGPVLAQAQIPVLDYDTTGSLTGKLSLTGAELLMEVIARYIKGEITPKPQNDAEATYCRMITKEEGEIDWTLPAVEIWRRVRAYQPWPGCYTHWQEKQLKILEAVPLSGGEGIPEGQVTEAEKRAG
ncbi:methionyl-tRNA formyltransferase, partial [Chloroflexota bacterium]